MMKKFVLIVVLAVLCSACSRRVELTLHTSYLSGSLSLIPQMQQIPDTQQLIYQEVSNTTGETLDSLIIDTEPSELSVLAYAQQHFNKLRLQGYQLSQEVTKKGKLKIGSSSERQTILKTYRIINVYGVKLYVAQYYVPLDKTIAILSYASDTLSHISAFTSSLDQLSFSF